MSQLPRPTSTISSGSSSLSREASSVTSGSLTGTTSKLTKLKSSGVGSISATATGDNTEKFLVGDKVCKSCLKVYNKGLKLSHHIVLVIFLIRHISFERFGSEVQNQAGLHS